MSFGACGRNSGIAPSTQGAAPTTSASVQAASGQAADLAGSAATASTETLANAPAGAAGTANAASAPAMRRTAVTMPRWAPTSLEKIADLPTQHQLPDGRWKAGVNYDPVVPRSADRRAGRQGRSPRGLLVRLPALLCAGAFHRGVA